MVELTESILTSLRKSKRALFTLGAMLMLCLGIHVASIFCQAETSSAVIDADVEALLQSESDNVILPIFAAAQDAAKSLDTAVADYATAVANSSSDTAAKLTTAQSAWRTMMSTWQEAEIVQIGPAAIKTNTGGQALRDEIYSWPTVSTCRIDQEIVANNFSNADFFASQLVNSYGLAALEYLLFNTATTNTCASTVAINSGGTWAALTTQEKSSRRALYAKAVAAKIAVDADKIVEALKNDFLAQLKKAGQSGSLYKTQNTALTEVFQALFYVESATQDKKLATPIGLSNCSTSICLGALESQYAAYSKEEIIANLKGLQKAFLGAAPGTEQKGFDDFLKARGAASIADSMAADIAAARATAEAISGTLDSSLTADVNVAKNLYTAIKKVTDRLEDEVAITLKLQIPKEVAGDTD